MNEISDTINNESNIEIISLKNTNDHEDLCSICIENIIDNNISLPCEHSFHIECILRWAYVQITNKMFTTCPFCKLHYNFTVFAKRIMIHYIRELYYLIEQLNFLIKDGELNLINRQRAKKIRKDYKKYALILENIKRPANSRLLYIKIRPIPSDIILLIAKTKQNILNKKNNHTDELLQTSYPCIVKIKNILKYIFKIK
jgi:hypothetical protein